MVVWILEIIMSVCKVENGQKRKHKYEGTNKCTVCGHETTHGANFIKMN